MKESGFINEATNRYIQQRMFIYGFISRKIFTFPFKIRKKEEYSSDSNIFKFNLRLLIRFNKTTFLVKSVQVPQISADQLRYSCQAISDNSTNLLVISYTSNIMMHLIVTSVRKNTKIIWLHWFTMFQRAMSPRIRYLDKRVNELVAVDGSGANIAFNMI